MTPLDFLNEEAENVKRALNETLRYDYGPQQSRAYYAECVSRLEEIEKAIHRINPSDAVSIQDTLRELQHLSSWMLLIERSHLGEFSWPFSAELKRIATQLLTTKDLRGDDVQPLIHVVAEGEGYQIVYEAQVPGTSMKRPFVVVAFKRSLKHHALLHTIFGHELAHTALNASDWSAVIGSQVIGALKSFGPLSTSNSATRWIHEASAPVSVQTSQQQYARLTGAAFVLEEQFWESWVEELMCDIFGLILFGPAFLAAHQALLEPSAPDPYAIYYQNATHPPYAMRHKALVKCMRLLNWDSPIASMKRTTLRKCEESFLSHLLTDRFDVWADVFTDAQLIAAIGAISQVVDTLGDSTYRRMDSRLLETLVDNIKNGIPPVSVSVGKTGKLSLRKVRMAQTLYAGWVYCLGVHELGGSNIHTFFEINRLCDHALLQQIAINLVIDGS